MKARKNCKGRGEGCRGRWGLAGVLSLTWDYANRKENNESNSRTAALSALFWTTITISPELSQPQAQQKQIHNQLIYNAHKGFGKVTFSLLWADSNLLISTAVLQRRAHLSCSSCGVVAHHQFTWKWKALAEVWNCHTRLHPQPQMTELTSG